MRGINKAIIVGSLGADPDIRHTPNGDQVTNISVATTGYWRDSEGGNQSKTEWHKIVFFKKLAEISGQYLKKGSNVYIEGKIQTRKWQDQNGADRYSTEIIANQMQLLGGGGDAAKSVGVPAGRQGAFGAQSSSHGAPNSNQMDIENDDIPF